MDTIKDELQKFTADLHDFVAKNFKSDTHHVALLGLTFHVKEKKGSEGDSETDHIIHALSCHRNSQGQIVCD